MSDESTDECCICFCKLDTECQYKNTCDHIFHKECIEKWLDSGSTCPVCRANIPINNELFPNYDGSNNKNINDDDPVFGINVVIFGIADRFVSHPEGTGIFISSREEPLSDYLERTGINFLNQNIFETRENHIDQVIMEILNEDNEVTVEDSNEEDDDLPELESIPIDNNERRITEISNYVRILSSYIIRYTPNSFDRSSIMIRRRSIISKMNRIIQILWSYITISSDMITIENLFRKLKSLELCLKLSIEEAENFDRIVELTLSDDSINLNNFGFPFPIPSETHLDPRRISRFIDISTSFMMEQEHMNVDTSEMDELD